MSIEWRSLMRAPGRTLGLTAYAAALAAVLVVWAGLQMPALGLKVLPHGEQVRLVDAAGRVLADVDPAIPLLLSGPDGQVTGPAGDFVQDKAPDSAAVDVAAWFADRSRLAGWAGQGVELSIPGHAPWRLSPRPRALSDLSLDVWLLLGGGASVLLMGVWAASLRPADPGPRAFLLASAGVALCAYSGAFYDARELAADGDLLWALITLNFVGASLSAGGSVAQFLLFPRRLAPAWILAPLALAEAAWGLAGGRGWLSSAAYYAGLLAHLPVLAGALLVQWRRTAGDPRDRAILRWVGASSALGGGVLTCGMAAPQLLGTPSLASDGFAFLPLLVVYGGMGLAVARAGLFDLDRWAFRVIAAAFAVLAFLALDAALAFALHLSGPFAFSLALTATAAAYLPLRARLWRWIAGGPGLDQATMFEAAARAAFQPDPDNRREEWAGLLRRLYDPLELAPGPAAAEPSLSADRLQLSLPPIAGAGALSLRAPSQGRRLFRPEDLRLARQLVDLMRRAEAARDSYADGVREERARIARDLHDDVGARLLTSLHRDAVGDMRQDVRRAIGEMRLIFSGLAGDRVDLGRLLADLRYEASERVSAAGAVLDWPAPLADYPAHALPYELYKAVTASVRELVSNSLKHARPGRISVRVALAADTLRLVVSDDGTAADGPAGVGRGLGNLAARAQALGGTFVFRLEPTGAVAEVVLPLPLAPVQGEDAAAPGRLRLHPSPPEPAE